MNDSLTVPELRQAKQDAENEIAAAVSESVEDLKEKTDAKVERVSLSLRTVTTVDGSNRVVDVDVDVSLDI
jgi:hypothetical protein